MPPKPKIALYWCASCGGCEEAVVDLGEHLLELVAAVEIVLWPVAMDFKKRDVEALADGALAAAFVNGAIRTDEQEEWARLLRRKAQLLFAVGACAQLGGIPGLANLSCRDEVFATVYEDLASSPAGGGTRPATSWPVAEGVLTLPRFHDSVRTLSQVVTVDYTIPGCAPPPELLWQAIQALLNGALPPPGAVLAPNISLCDQCPHAASKPERFELQRIRRPADSPSDGDRCLLADGFLCLGPVTRAGCGHRCIKVNQGCRGCCGPLDGVTDQGARFLSTLASILAAGPAAGVDDAVASIADPTGTFYRFSLAASTLRGRRRSVSS